MLALRTYEEGFWKCLIYRQILSLRKLDNYDRSMEDKNKIESLANFKPFTGFGSHLTVSDIFVEYDWAEPLPMVSPWLIRRRALVGQVREHILSLPQYAADVDFLEFLFALVLHTTGSDELVSALETNLQHLEFGNIVFPGQMIGKYVHDLHGLVFHTRFLPMTIWANGVDSALKTKELRLWSSVGADDEMEEEETEPLKKTAERKQSGRQTGNAINATSLAIKCLESMQTVKKLREIFGRLKKDPSDAWEVCSAIKGFKGYGSNLKNFSLIYFPVSLIMSASSGGTGPRQCYNVSMGAPRKQHMSSETLNLLVHRDKIQADAWWNGNHFGRKLYDLLPDDGRKLGAVAITSNRCEYDKITWKVAGKCSAPDGFATWRDYTRHLRRDGH